MKKYSVLIVGAGNIGAFFDNPASRDVLTHAHAFTKVKGFELLGFFDVDYEKAKEAAIIWGTRVFNDIDEVFNNNDVDIVSICVPDEYHFEIAKKVLDYMPKLLFLEKPLSRTIDEAEQIVSLCKEKDIPVLVNYSRRFVTEFEDIKYKFNQGKFGGFVGGTAYYGKGVLHNGSHLIDLLRYILGEVKNSEVVKAYADFYLDDPSVTGILEFDNNTIVGIHGIPCNYYTIFEIDLFFEKTRLRIVNSGFNIEVYGIENSEKFTGYQMLNRLYEYSTELNIALENAVMNIYNYMEDREELRCTVDDAYETMKICEHLRRLSFEKENNDILKGSRGM